MVRDIVRTRTGALENDTGPPADLIVLWQEEAPTDVVESEDVGRIGPLPYFRCGGHSSRGFVLASGRRFGARSTIADIRAEELPRFMTELLEPARSLARA
jgi:hypothetical protein